MEVGGDGEAEVESVAVEEHADRAGVVGVVGFYLGDEAFEVAVARAWWSAGPAGWVEGDLTAGPAGDRPASVVHGSVVEGAQHHQVTFGARRGTSGT